MIEQATYETECCATKCNTTILILIVVTDQILIVVTGFSLVAPSLSHELIFNEFATEKSLKNCSFERKKNWIFQWNRIHTEIVPHT